MTSRAVYLGDPADEQFEFEGGEPAGNFPGRLGPAWPLNRQGEDHLQWGVYSRIVGLAMSGQFEGRQADWGCWVLRMTRGELLAFLDECYGQGPVYPPEWTIRGQRKEDHEIRRFVRRLDPCARHLLVALET